MDIREIKAFARIVALSSMMGGKIVHVKRPDGLYIGRLGGWTDTKRLAARYHYDDDRVADQLMQVEFEHGEEWDAELVEQESMSKAPDPNDAFDRCPHCAAQYLKTEDISQAAHFEGCPNRRQ